MKYLDGLRVLKHTINPTHNSIQEWGGGDFIDKEEISKVYFEGIVVPQSQLTDQPSTDAKYVIRKGGVPEGANAVMLTWQNNFRKHAGQEEQRYYAGVYCTVERYKVEKE